MDCGPSRVLGMKMRGRRLRVEESQVQLAYFHPDLKVSGIKLNKKHWVLSIGNHMVHIEE